MSSISLSTFSLLAYAQTTTATRWRTRSNLIKSLLMLFHHCLCFPKNQNWQTFRMILNFFIANDKILWTKGRRVGFQDLVRRLLIIEFQSSSIMNLVVGQRHVILENCVPFLQDNLFISKYVFQRPSRGAPYEVRFKFAQNLIN